MDVRSIVKQHIVTEMMHEFDQNTLGDNDALVEGGILDSMNLIRLVAFIEGKFGITVSEDELDIDNFRTINALSDFIKKKI